MTPPRFKIVFDGALMPDASLETTKDNLARLFKSDRTRIETLFGSGPIAIKRDLLEAEADQYLAALQRAGARARKEPDLVAALSLVETDEQLAAKAQPDAVPQPMVCPKCGHQQDKAAECSACGVIIDKYLARQALLGESAAAQPAAPPPVSAVETPYAPPRAKVDASQDEVGPLKVLSFNGRIGRLRYLAWSLVLMIAFVILGAVLSAVDTLSETLGGALLFVAVVGMLVVTLQIGVQRLHDMGWSGWLWLLNLVPIVNSVFWLLMLVVPGTLGANRFGPQPPANSLAVNLLAGLFLLLIVAGLLVLLLGGFAALAVFGLFFEQLADLDTLRS